MTDTTTGRWAVGHTADVMGSWMPPLPEYAVFNINEDDPALSFHFAEADAQLLADYLNHLESKQVKPFVEDPEVEW